MTLFKAIEEALNKKARQRLEEARARRNESPVPEVESYYLYRELWEPSECA